MKIKRFKTEKKFLRWEAKKGNCIYALQDKQGKWVGDIREEDLIPLLDSNKIISLDDADAYSVEVRTTNMLVLDLDSVKEKTLKIIFLQEMFA